MPETRIYNLEKGEVAGKRLIEFPVGQSFHASHQQLAEPFAEINVAALPPGRYAIMAYHDADLNGKFDLRFGMFPTEGYGLSNNPKVMGPPKFADSAFDVAGPKLRVI